MYLLLLLSACSFLGAGTAITGMLKPQNHATCIPVPNQVCLAFFISSSTLSMTPAIHIRYTGCSCTGNSRGIDPMLKNIEGRTATDNEPA